MRSFGYVPMGQRYTLGNLGLPDFATVRKQIGDDLVRLKNKYKGVLRLGVWTEYMKGKYSIGFYYPFDPATKGLPAWTVLQTGNLSDLDIEVARTEIEAEIDRLTARFATWGLLRDNASEWQSYIMLLDALYTVLIDQAQAAVDAERRDAASGGQSQPSSNVQQSSPEEKQQAAEAAAAANVGAAEQKLAEAQKKSAEDAAAAAIELAKAQRALEDLRAAHKGSANTMILLAFVAAGAYMIYRQKQRYY